MRGLTFGMVIAGLYLLAGHVQIENTRFSFRGNSALALAVAAVLVPLAIVWGWTWVSDRWSGRSGPRLLLFTLGLIVGTALAFPLDHLVFDRKRIAELFDYEYVLEMYKPAAQRRWGYYALPILDGDTLIGKLDATADRKGGVLRVHAVHEDEPFSPAELSRVWAEVDELARWLELEVERPN